MDAKVTQLFTGTFVQVPKKGGDLEIFREHVLAVDDSGTIVDFVEKNSERALFLLSASEREGFKRINAHPGSFFLPTFSDLHLHAPQFLYLGTGLHLPLMDWLGEYAYKAEERLDADPVLARNVYSKLTRRLIESGTGAALLFGTIKEETK